MPVGGVVLGEELVGEGEDLVGVHAAQTTASRVRRE